MDPIDVIIVLGHATSYISKTCSCRYDIYTYTTSSVRRTVKTTFSETVKQWRLVPVDIPLPAFFFFFALKKQLDTVWLVNVVPSIWNNKLKLAKAGGPHAFFFLFAQRVHKCHSQLRFIKANFDGSSKSHNSARLVVACCWNS